ncbi:MULTISPECIES: EAL domain-containing protein [Marinobacter]|uniref:Diguanylate cyclase/phosphodiesterase n=1 Tax=Marinobacter manganoxydans MnI7-9 TaxID=1094979 RepID=G6YU88_9GAMM|nr:EAL domain-containing protein [Marinobacter manganoxydans]EHJ04377.1 diguanylate cyclase/phosphodiesterase [Marinobacter manganoxydans MnI7-9]
MSLKSHTSLSNVQLTMLVLAFIVVLFLWALFIWQNSTKRTEALDSQISENRNLALIVSESLKQMTVRGKVMGRLLHGNLVSKSEDESGFLTLLAEDPVFNRFSIYDASGDLLYASHTESARSNLQSWLTEAETHFAHSGLAPLLPNRLDDPAYTPGDPAWRLPFLVPLSDSGSSQPNLLVLIELDIGYLASLMQNVELGSGFIQILDSAGNEWMRASESGIVIGGPALPKMSRPQEGRVITSDAVINLPEGRYQYVSVSRPINGFTIAVAQPLEEVLAPLALGQAKQLAANTLMTALVVGIVIWLIHGLKKQQQVLEALRTSEQSNRKLIERLETENARSNRAATIDHLSGLLNRRQFLDEAKTSVLEQRRARRLSSMLFIDLDRFKSINDSLGHHVGDMLLQAVAGRIQRMLAPGDIAARFGGDEFVVLLLGDRTEAGIEQWASALTDHLSAPYMLEGTELNTSSSIGIAISPRDGQSVDQLTRCADAAMYSAKKAGRGQYRFFDQSLNVTDVEEFHLEQAFTESLRNRDFLLHYQPQVCLDSMEVIGYEALVRWQHPSFGLLYPDKFIPLSEKTGFVVKLGMEVLRLACVQISEWQQMLGVSKPIAVNVSPIQLSQPDFCANVLTMLSDMGLNPDLLELEITETAMLESRAVETLHRLKQAGIRLSLDDFGTGYAGFAHLEAVPVDKLKIDRSLINRISNSHDDSPIVSSTIILARRMAIQVVAEGVETHDQLVHLKVAGCHIAQGYFLGRPMPAEKILDFERAFTEKENVV